MSVIMNEATKTREEIRGLVDLIEQKQNKLITLLELLEIEKE